MTSWSTGKACQEGRLLGTWHVIICRWQPTLSVDLALFLIQPPPLLPFLLALRSRAALVQSVFLITLPSHPRRVAAGVDEVWGEEQFTPDPNCPTPHPRLNQSLTSSSIMLGKFCLACPLPSLGICHFDFWFFYFYFTFDSLLRQTSSQILSCFKTLLGSLVYKHLSSFPL